ncbi:diacylglycerol O-acyltransferase [Thraustotheca clavata]|uniref:Acyltransferase n=1 Tax=Thraustotheca clavata TaxID=74557 RepID=A0A1V9Y8H4_9STRA|nr:diacylglycerol O-acyltransferase [Thraustotheca clavata]
MSGNTVRYTPERVLTHLPEAFRSALQFIIVFISIHYLQWAWAALIVLYYFYHIGYGYISIALVAVYLPMFLNGAHRKVTPEKGGKQWKGLRNHGIWNLMCEYLGMEIIREQELDPEKQYIFSCHPHGILVLSRLSYYAGNFDALFPGIAARVLGATPMFYIPLGRELCLWLDAVDASRSTAQKVLDNKMSIIVYPGGSKEIFETNPDSKETVLVLNNRLGFIKLAMKNGANLVPTFVFGEKWIMWNPPKTLSQMALQYLKVPLLLFWGRFCTWVPYQLTGKRKLGIVYGAPILVELNENPTDEECLKLHAKYVESIERIFDTYKTEFGYDDGETLVIA